MALVDEKVFTASTGYVFKAPVGTAAPSRAALKNFNPETFGASSVKVTLQLLWHTTPLPLRSRLSFPSWLRLARET